MTTTSARSGDTEGGDSPFFPASASDPFSARSYLPSQRGFDHGDDDRPYHNYNQNYRDGGGDDPWWTATTTTTTEKEDGGIDEQSMLVVGSSTAAAASSASGLGAPAPWERAEGGRVGGGVEGEGSALVAPRPPWLLQSVVAGLGASSDGAWAAACGGVAPPRGGWWTAAAALSTALAVVAVACVFRYRDLLGQLYEYHRDDRSSIRTLQNVLVTLWELVHSLFQRYVGAPCRQVRESAAQTVRAILGQWRMPLALRRGAGRALRFVVPPEMPELATDGGDGADNADGANAAEGAVAGNGGDDGDYPRGDRRRRCNDPRLLEPAFLNPEDYPEGWLVYHPELGVVLKTVADAHDKEQQQTQQRQQEHGQQDRVKEQHQRKPPGRWSSRVSLDDSDSTRENGAEPATTAAESPPVPSFPAGPSRDDLDAAAVAAPAVPHPAASTSPPGPPPPDSGGVTTA